MPTHAIAPPLSVVVVSFNRDVKLLEKCLRALAGQPMASQMEVIVVHAGDAFDAVCLRDFAEAFPAGFAVHATDANIPHLRRAGIERSRGEVVAVIEDDCLVDPAWAQTLLEAHQEAAAAVGGAVEPGAYRTMRDWAGYLSDYSPFMLPFVPDDTPRLAGSNLSYPRAVVRELLAATASDGLQEAFLHGRWHAEGKRLRAEPAIVVRNEHRWKLRELVVVPFFHGRAYGGQRASEWTRARRVMFALASAALPLLHVARVVRRVRARHRRDVPIVRALPFIGLYGSAWGAGEFVGYVAGPGAALRRWR
jgi:glycosyltransferase involved in cell wall biosynthesis